MGNSYSSTIVAPAAVSLSRRSFLRGRAHVATVVDSIPHVGKAVIGTACLALRGVECRVCGESCSQGAICFRPSLGAVARPIVSDDVCTGCGDCVAPCPTNAIPPMHGDKT